LQSDGINGRTTFLPKMREGGSFIFIQAPEFSLARYPLGKFGCYDPYRKV
jgi:hypothetical protein